MPVRPREVTQFTEHEREVERTLKSQDLQLPEHRMGWRRWIAHPIKSFFGLFKRKAAQEYLHEFYGTMGHPLGREYISTALWRNKQYVYNKAHAETLSHAINGDTQWFLRQAQEDPEREEEWLGLAEQMERHGTGFQARLYADIANRKSSLMINALKNAQPMRYRFFPFFTHKRIQNIIDTHPQHFVETLFHILHRDEHKEIIDRIDSMFATPLHELVRPNYVKGEGGHGGGAHAAERGDEGQEGESRERPGERPNRFDVELRVRSEIQNYMRMHEGQPPSQEQIIAWHNHFSSPIREPPAAGESEHQRPGAQEEESSRRGEEGESAGRDEPEGATRRPNNALRADADNTLRDDRPSGTERESGRDTANPAPTAIPPGPAAEEAERVVEGKVLPKFKEGESVKRRIRTPPITKDQLIRLVVANAGAHARAESSVRIGYPGERGLRARPIGPMSPLEKARRAALYGTAAKKARARGASSRRTAPRSGR